MLPKAPKNDSSSGELDTTCIKGMEHIPDAALDGGKNARWKSTVKEPFMYFLLEVLRYLTPPYLGHRGMELINE